LIVGLPTGQASHNDGLLVNVALGPFMALGFSLALTVFDLASPRPDLFEALGASLSFGVPAGVLGFGTGAGATRLHDRRQ
jgi:hypothetical protein